ncbi:MAG: ABC transporter substrate-binding protein [Pseudomonadota bacterium]
MTRGLATCLGVWATAAVLCGCAPTAEPKAATDAPTFVSLNPCLDAILVEVAAPQQILALSHYSRDPNASSITSKVARRYSYTGGTAEEVLTLNPDIVLASTYMDPATRSALERSGLRVETFGSPTSVEASVEQVQSLASFTGAPARAKPLLRDLKVKRWPPVVPELVHGPKWPPRSDPSVLLWQAGEIVQGEQTLIAQLLAESGFVSHAQKRGLGQADRVALEEVLADPPDLLLVAGESAGQQHKALQKLESVRIASFDPRLFYCGGPSIPFARDELAKLRMSFVDSGE